MAEGREIEILERIAVALEKTVAEPEFLQGNPPGCPHCGQFDPVVYMLPQEEMEGNLSQYVIHGRCKSCGEMLWALVESYSMHRSLETAIEEMNAKREAGYFSG